MKYLIKHTKFDKIKHISDTELTVNLNGVETSIELSELTKIIKELDFAKKLKSSYGNHTFFSRFFKEDEKEYLYYHQELRDKISKHLIGKKKIDLYKDCEDSSLYFMQLKSVYELFFSFELVSHPEKGDVLITSLDDLIEPSITSKE